MRKNLFIIIILIIMMLCIACGESEDSNSSNTEPTTEIVNENQPSSGGLDEIIISNDDALDGNLSNEVTIDSLLEKPVVSEEMIYCYDDGNGGVVLTSYSGTDTVVALPETYQDKPINSIDMYAFGVNSEVQAIKFPDSVKEIGAFSCSTNSSLKIVVCGEKTELIGESAFHASPELKTVILNDGLKTISVFSFAQCSNLMSLYIPESVTEIDNNAFYGHPDDFMIYGVEGSVAEAFAKENNIPFEVR